MFTLLVVYPLHQIDKNICLTLEVILSEIKPLLFRLYFWILATFPCFEDYRPDKNPIEIMAIK